MLTSDRLREAIELIQAIRRGFKVRVSIHWEPSGPTSGAWIIKAMTKQFSHKDFPVAMAKMAEFVLNAHNVNNAIQPQTENGNGRNKGHSQKI